MNKYKRFLVDLKPQEYDTINEILKQYNLKKSEILRYVIEEINSSHSIIISNVLFKKGKYYHEEKRKLLYKK